MWQLRHSWESVLAMVFQTFCARDQRLARNFSRVLIAPVKAKKSSLVALTFLKVIGHQLLGTWQSGQLAPTPDLFE